MAQVSAGITAVALVPLLVARWKQHLPAVAAAKTIASLGFLGVAFALPAGQEWFATATRVGLVLSFLGDLFLIGAARRWVMAGLVAFLLAHLAYVAAAAPLAAANPMRAAAVVGGFAVAALLVWRWIGVHARAKQMPGPAAAYVGMVSLSAASLVAAGVAAPDEPGRVLLLIGGPLLWVSDLAVARQRLMVDSFWNRAWGLPCYYAGQLCLAFAIGAVIPAR